MVQKAEKEPEREELPERWSAQRKAEVVLRLLRGEALEARRAVSPATGRRYPLAMVCEVYRIARSSVYASLGRGEGIGPCRKRGPRTQWTDEELVQEIRTVLRESRFLGEGHRKVTARLRFRGVQVGKNRILRLMRRNGLLTPVRCRHPHGDRTHQGTIRTQRPDELWGTDATRFYTEEDGWCSFFGAIDHCCEDIVGWHVAKKKDRWAALEPIRQGVRCCSSPPCSMLWAG